MQRAEEGVAKHKVYKFLANINIEVDLCIFVCMNAYISVIISARDNKFDMKLLLEHTQHKHLS